MALFANLRVVHIQFGRKFFRFVVVGGVGFCVDAGILTLLMWLGWGVFPARIVSFTSAVTCTWVLNKFWTFDAMRHIRIHTKYFLYVGAQVLGAVINLSIFYLIIRWYPTLRSLPLIPLAIGATVSLLFNYLISKNFVFKG